MSNYRAKTFICRHLLRFVMPIRFVDRTPALNRTLTSPPALSPPSEGAEREKTIAAQGGNARRKFGDFSLRLNGFPSPPRVSCPIRHVRFAQRGPREAGRERKPELSGNRISMR